MFQLENKYILYALAIIPLVLLLQFFLLQWRKKAKIAYGNIDTIEKLFPDVSKTKRAWKFILYTIALLFLITGIANPQVGTKLENIKRKGADIMICLDVSNSMKAEDFYPNRLEKAKQAISKLISSLEGDRIGIIVFAGEAFVQLPITTDYAASKLFLDGIRTDLVAVQGTNIGDAIDLAVESFGKDDGKNKAIIVITDGEDNEAEGINAAKRAAEKNIVVHTIGMGSPSGAPIPTFKNGVKEGYKKDKDGNTIITRLNVETLKQIASAGNGIYVQATNSDTGLNSILNEINKLEKKQFESKMYSDYEDRFQWFISVAFILLLIEIFISERKSKFFKRLNLFGNEKK
ncbi:MAG: VWA domain-containing protein [Bacteroidia bacterium]